MLFKVIILLWGLEKELFIFIPTVTDTGFVPENYPLDWIPDRSPKKKKHMLLPLLHIFPYLGSIFLQTVFAKNVLKAPKFCLRNYSFPNVSPTIKVV